MQVLGEFEVHIQRTTDTLDRKVLRTQTVLLLRFGQLLYENVDGTDGTRSGQCSRGCSISANGRFLYRVSKWSTLEANPHYRSPPEMKCARATLYSAPTNNLRPLANS